MVRCIDIDGAEHDVPAEQLSWRPSAYAIIIHDDKILLAKQSGRYDLPGGGVEIDESVEVAVIREVKEETGLDATNPQRVGFASNFFHTIYSNKSYHSILLYFTCDVIGGELSTDEFVGNEIEYGELAEWVPLDELDDIPIISTVDFRPYVKNVLRQI